MFSINLAGFGLWLFISLLVVLLSSLMMMMMMITDFWPVCKVTYHVPDSWVSVCGCDKVSLPPCKGALWSPDRGYQGAFSSLVRWSEY